MHLNKVVKLKFLNSMLFKINIHRDITTNIIINYLFYNIINEINKYILRDSNICIYYLLSNNKDYYYYLWFLLSMFIFELVK